MSAAGHPVSLPVLVARLTEKSMAPAPAGPGVWAAICPICHPLGALAGDPTPTLTVAEQAGALVVHCGYDGCLSRRSPQLVLVLIGLPAPAASLDVRAEFPGEPGPSLDAADAALAGETADELQAVVALLSGSGGTLVLDFPGAGAPPVLGWALPEDGEGELDDAGEDPGAHPAAESMAGPSTAEPPPAPAPHRRGVPVETIMERISRWLQEQPAPASRNALETGVGGNCVRLREALDRLAADGWVETEQGPRRAVLLRSVRPYREGAEALTSPAAPVRPADELGEHELGELDLVDGEA